MSRRAREIILPDGVKESDIAYLVSALYLRFAGADYKKPLKKLRRYSRNLDTAVEKLSPVLATKEGDRARRRQLRKLTFAYSNKIPKMHRREYYYELQEQENISAGWFVVDHLQDRYGHLPEYQYMFDPNVKDHVKHTRNGQDLDRGQFVLDMGHLRIYVFGRILDPDDTPVEDDFEAHINRELDYQMKKVKGCDTCMDYGKIIQKIQRFTQHWAPMPQLLANKVLSKK